MCVPPCVCMCVHAQLCNCACVLCAGCTDGLMINVSAVCLRFCRPFVEGFLAREPKHIDLFTKHINPQYYTLQAHRLGDLSATNTLVGVCVWGGKDE